MKRVYPCADSGFYCREATEAYEKKNWHYIVMARKTARLIEQLQRVEWKPSPKTDADQCDLEQVAREAGKLNRQTFLFTLAPGRIQGGTGLLVNRIATF